MILPGGDYVAVQRIPSSDLVTFVNRAVVGMLPSPGDPGIVVMRPFLTKKTPAPEDPLG